MAAQELEAVTEGFVFQSNLPMSPFERTMGAHQERQRLSLDAASLVRQSSSLEGLSFERKQAANRRWAALCLFRRPPQPDQTLKRLLPLLMH